MNYKLFVGIDQSKKTFDAAMLHADSPEILIHRQFDNNQAGFKSMMKWIYSKFPVSVDEILFCSENTGIYSFPLSVFLHEAHAHLWLENALQIKRSSGMKRGKSDPADARMIANYCFLHRDKVKLYSLPDKRIVELKHLLAFRERMIKHLTAYKITSKELSEFGADESRFIDKESKSIIRTLMKKIKATEEQMLQLIGKDEKLSQTYELITSVHCVGKQTALFILAHSNGFTHFKDWRAFACYCGIAPFPYLSGTSIKGKTRVSHLANKKLKSLLTMCALNTLKSKNEFKIYYDRRISEGKNSMSTINVLRNKIVSRIFAAVKRGTPYQKDLQLAA